MNLNTDFDFTTNVSKRLGTHGAVGGGVGQSIKAFHDGDHRSLGDALNEQYWRHGLTVSLGNGLSVSEDQARRRLRYVACRLKRLIWGQKNQRKIEVIVFKHWMVNRHKKKQELERGSRNWSDRQQQQLVDERHQALKTIRGRHDRVGEHWHAVMAVEGKHGWTDQQIADAINAIEADRKREWRGEKAINVDFNWQKNNAFHSYVGREAKYDGDSYFMMRI